MPGNVWRKVVFLSEEECRRRIAKASELWQRGESVVRKMMELRTWTAIDLYDERVFTDLQWWTDFRVEDTPLRKPFLHYMNRASLETGTDENLQATMMFSTFKCLESSDTPNWFRLSDGLSWKLATTELRGIRPSDVKLPFPGFYVEVPDGLFQIFCNTTGMHTVRALGVSEGWAPAIDRVEGRRLLIHVYCDPNENSTDVGDDFVMWIEVPLFDESRTVDQMVLEDESDEPAAYKYDGRHGGTFAGNVVTNAKLRELVRKFVMNILLYMNSDKADVRHVHRDKVRALKKSKGRKKNKERRGKLEKENTWIVGTNVIFDPRVKNLAESGREGQSLRFKSLVRGHWRQQAHGEGRKLRRLLWIEPHVRGGDLPGKVLGHNYSIKCP